MHQCAHKFPNLFKLFSRQFCINVNCKHKFSNLLIYSLYVALMYFYTRRINNTIPSLLFFHASENGPLSSSQGPEIHHGRIIQILSKNYEAFPTIIYHLQPKIAFIGELNYISIMVNKWKQVFGYIFAILVMVSFPTNKPTIEKLSCHWISPFRK